MGDISLGHEAPVFIVGMNGSGTTMLADALGRHPDIYVLREESKILPFILTQGRRYGDPQTLAGRRRIADVVTKSVGFWRSNGRIDFAIPDEELDRPGIPAVIDAIYRHLASKVGKTRWGDKSPVNSLYVELLGAAFPDARFIHIVRDPRDAAQSFHRRWGFDPMHTVCRWKQHVSAARIAGLRLGERRYREISYERLTAIPSNVMREVCDFADLSFDERVLESEMRQAGADLRQVADGRIVLNSGKWRGYFAPNLIDRMERLSGKLMEELGYEVRVQGEETPGFLLQKYWLMKDRVRFLHFSLSTWGMAVWPDLRRHITAAMRQARVGRR